MSEPKDDRPAEEQRTIFEERPPAIVPVEELTLDGTGRASVSGPAPLSRLADYELIVEVGRGGMGVVYKARQIKLGRTVAVKMILGGSLARPDDLQRFEMEAAAAAGLQHPGIVAVYEVGCHDNQPYFSMEYISGSSLALTIANGPVAGRKAATYLEPTARAVHFAHERGILHRDLKPANVLLDEADHPKVTDFGLAKVLSTDSGQTRTGAVLGTPSYMSPEQAQGRKDIAPAGDIYSLGAILYELLTGRPPFRGETALATLALVANQEPIAPRLLVPSVDRDLETICLKCLEKDAKRRYPTAEALADDLRRYLDGEPIAARRVSVVGRAVKWCRRKPWQAALLGMSLAAVAGFILFQHQNARQERELRAQAEDARAKAQLREKTMAYLLYHAHMRRAQQSLENADWDRAEHLLNTWAEPKSNLSDLRDWEWFFLKGRCGGRYAFFAHAGSATAVAYRPDGKQIASAGGEPKKPHAIKIWDPTTGALVAALPGHANKISALAYNGTDARPADLLASCGFDGLVKVWDVKSGKLRWFLDARPGHVNGVCFSSDGRWLASAGSSGSIGLWDLDALRRGEKVKPLFLKGHTREVSSVAFSPTSSLLASGSFDGVVKLWDVVQAKEVETLTGHRGEVHCLAFSPQGKFLATGGGRGARSGEIKLWDVEAGKARLARNGLSDSVLSLSYGASGKLAAAGSDGILRIWDQPLASEAITFRGDNQLVYSIALSPDGHRLASAGHSGRITLHNTSGGLETRVLPMTGQIEALAISPKGRFLAAGNNDGSIKLWALDASAKAVTLPGAGNAVLALAFAPDGNRLAVSCVDQFIRIYNLEHPEQMPTVITGRSPRLRTLAFSKDGKHLASASDIDDAVRIWDPLTGELVTELKGHTNGILSIAFSPDGLSLASGSYDKTVRVWDWKTGKATILEGHHGSVNGVAFSGDGGSLASVSSDHTLRVWDLRGDQRDQVFEGSPGQLFSVAFHPQGRRLATVGQDKTVRLWDVVARQEILELEDVSGSLRQVAFSPDGRFLAVAGKGVVRVWDSGRVFPHVSSE